MLPVFIIEVGYAIKGAICCCPTSFSHFLELTFYLKEWFHYQYQFHIQKTIQTISLDQSMSNIDYTVIYPEIIVNDSLLVDSSKSHQAGIES